MGFAEANLNPQQFDTSDGGPSHIAPGPKKVKKLDKANLELKNHIFNAHIRSNENGKVWSVPEGVTDAKKWHQDMHDNEQFEWRRDHTHE